VAPETNATLVDVAATDHDPLSTGPDMKCGPKIAYAFISDPGAEVDAACAEKGKLKFSSMADAFKALQAKSTGHPRDHCHPRRHWGGHWMRPPASLTPSGSS